MLCIFHFWKIKTTHQENITKPTLMFLIFFSLRFEVDFKLIT